MQILQQTFDEYLVLKLNKNKNNGGNKCFQYYIKKKDENKMTLYRDEKEMKRDKIEFRGREEREEREKYYTRLRCCVSLLVSMA